MPRTSGARAAAWGDCVRGGRHGWVWVRLGRRQVRTIPSVERCCSTCQHAGGAGGCSRAAGSSATGTVAHRPELGSAPRRGQPAARPHRCPAPPCAALGRTARVSECETNEVWLCVWHCMSQHTPALHPHISQTKVRTKYCGRLGWPRAPTRSQTCSKSAGPFPHPLITESPQPRAQSHSY